MTTWVFAGVNRRDRLPPELLSQFVTFDFKPYTREEFLEVAEAVITGQLGKDPDLARHPCAIIAETVQFDMEGSSYAGHWVSRTRGHPRE